MFTIRERMYFELHVDTEDRRLTIFGLDCFATPSQDSNALPRYDVIKDGYVSHTYNNNNNNIYYLYCAFSIKYSKTHHNSN